MRKALLYFPLLLSPLFSLSQNVTVDETSYTVEELITDVLVNSPCANVSNVTWSTGIDFGSVNGIAFFEEPSGVFPFNQGLVMSAGSVTLANGPNLAFNQSLGAAWPGDPELNVLAEEVTNNATIIEFDFVPVATEISFRFLMASEEYSPPGDGAIDYECEFSDVFAFFLTDGSGNTENLAVLPDTDIPILVTTVHPDNGASCGGANPQYFSQYVPLGLPPTGYDGFTRSFTAFSAVNPGETYHIKLAIADAVDSIVHSAVFLEAGSFNLGLDLGDDLLISTGNAKCDGSVITLNTGSPGAVHTWYKDGLVLLEETGSILEVTDPGEYSVEVVFSAECQSSDSIVIEFASKPVANPANDLIRCDGQFDLDVNDAAVLGGQDPAEVNITYHETQALADANISPLASPYSSISSPQTIYARIENTVNTDCFETTTFEIVVDDMTFSSPIADMTACDPDSNDETDFILSDNDMAVATSTGYAPGDVTISYHNSEADADAGINPLASPYTNMTNPETIYIRVVDNSNPNCNTTSNFDLIVNNSPEVQNVTLEQCDEDGSADGLTEYNLTEAESDFLISGDPTEFSFTYHLSQADALSGLNLQNPNPFTNSVNPQILYVRVENNNTSCFSIAELTLDVTATDVGDASLEVCDDDYDGFAEFTLTDADPNILTGLPPGLTVAYYATLSDAQLETDQLPDVFTNTIAALQTVYIRVEDGNNCYGIANMDLIVNPLPDNNTVENQSFCSDTIDNGSIDLTVFDSEVIGIQNPADLLISYHETQQDADANINALTSPYSNITNPQTIYVRVENINTACSMTFINFEIAIDPNPVLTDPTPLEVCDDNVPDGLTTVDLTLKSEEISGGNSNFLVTYYASQADADAGSNQLAIPYSNISNPQTIFARGENINTGCYSTITLELIIQQPPEAFTPPPLQYCDPDADGFGEFNLSELDDIISGGIAGLTVSYYETLANAENNENAIASPYNNITPNIQTIYARVDNNLTSNSCFAVTIITLVVESVPVFDLEDSYVLCIDTNGTEIIGPPVLDTELSAADHSFVWQLNGVDIAGANGPSYAPTSGGSYSVIVTDLSTGCESTDSTVVIESGPPIVTAQVTTVAFADNHVIEATATGPGEYEFSLDNGPWQSSGTFTGVRGGDHVVTARDILGCGIGTAQVLVIDYPKFFTPNGDGYHDTWNITGVRSLNDAKIYIFDRYGKLLRQLNPDGEGWNGTYNGELMPSDDYWFTIYYSESINAIKKEFRAHFTLKR